MATDSKSNVWLFLGKILGLSTLISVGIRFLGPSLPIPAVGSVALVLVLSPTVIMATVLALRAKSKVS